jgi:eukaryotic-like serine/threonine-protein kinase
MWGHMSTTDLPGSSLLANRYRLVERLGAGGMSVVWRGFDEVLGRQVAVKVLPPSTSADPSFRRRLRAEAQAAARLSHPNITNVYDYGEATTVDGEPVPYVVMELVDGESLAAVLARVRRLPWPAAVRICSEVSAALAAAHSRGIVHRDVTPANVMLTPAGAKVVDFGISALIGENDIDPDGSLLGTPAYLAPERLEGGQVSPATDVYAVGLLIYRTLIGQLPWDVGTTTALLRAHQYTEPEPLPPVEGLPPAVSALVHRCLEKRPTDRPSSAELAHVLAGVAASSPSARGFVPDWADSGEDTTILPSQQSYTEGLGRIRAGHAKVAESAPGRGVAAVPVASAAALAAQQAKAAPIEAPISPAPGSAIPVSVSDVKAVAAGELLQDSARASSAPAGSANSAGGNSAGGPEMASPSAGNGRSPAQGGARNSRFGSVPRSAPVASAAPASAVPPAPGAGSGPGSAAGNKLRPAFGSSSDQPSTPRPAGGGGGGTPPDRNGPGGSGPGGPGGSGPGSRGAGRGRANSRRVLVVAATVAVLGLATFGWSLAASRGPENGAAKPGPTVVAATGKCVVSYAVQSIAANGRFKAAVTVANRDDVTLKNWKLWFIMQGDQVVKGSSKVDLSQQDHIVTVNSGGPLSAGKAVTMNFTGRFSKSNAAPMVFQLNRKTCEAYVSAKPGEASRKVELLSDNTVRLTPVTKPPAGIAVGPGGVVIVKPGVTPDPSNGPTADPTVEPTVTASPTKDVTATESPDTQDTVAANPPTKNSPTPTEAASTVPVEVTAPPRPVITDTDPAEVDDGTDPFDQ